MDHSSDLPLITALPRAWIAFGRAPWQHVGLSALALLSSIGFALVGQDLRAVQDALLQRIGDVCVLCSLLVPIGPVLALLKLADRMLPEPPATSSANQRKPRGWLLRQAITLMVIELLVLAGALTVIQSLSWFLGTMSPTLAGLSVVLCSALLLHWLFTQVMALPLLVHHRHRALLAMAHRRELVKAKVLKVLAKLGLISGLNMLGLILASLGLLLSLPFSALVLMACCRTQTPWRSDSRRNMLPT